MSWTWSKTLELCVETLHFSLQSVCFNFLLLSWPRAKVKNIPTILLSRLFEVQPQSASVRIYILFFERLYNAAVFNNCNSMRALCFVIWIWQNATFAYEMQTSDYITTSPMQFHRNADSIQEEVVFESGHIRKLSHTGWVSLNKYDLSILHQSLSLIYIDRIKMWHFWFWFWLELCTFVIWIWQNATVVYEMQTRERLCSYIIFPWFAFCNNITNAFPLKWNSIQEQVVF